MRKAVFGALLSVLGCSIVDAKRVRIPMEKVQVPLLNQEVEQKTIEYTNRHGHKVQAVNTDSAL